jgi:pyruvate/2-oxoglutarate dehydrogenase complex dihydrolipoamide acyltransferase (E2) component
MAVAITIPRLGWNMDEGVFAGWLKQDGDEVRPGDALFRLESDKATEDVESLDGGTLRIAPGGPKEGDTVAVGTPQGGRHRRRRHPDRPPRRRRGGGPRA